MFKVQLMVCKIAKLSITEKYKTFSWIFLNKILKWKIVPRIMHKLNFVRSYFRVRVTLAILNDKYTRHLRQIIWNVMTAKERHLCLLVIKKSALGSLLLSCYGNIYVKNCPKLPSFMVNIHICKPNFKTWFQNFLKAI